MLKQYLQLKLSQKLSPQQIQLMKLIELPLQELEERLSREVVSLVQKMRKDSGYDITDRITTTIFSSDDILLSAIDKHKEYIMNETLSVTLNSVNKAGQESLLDFSLTVEMSKS